MARIATKYIGDPSLGPILPSGQRRALLGWNHDKDTPEGLRFGQIWCWTSQGPRPKFQVYDTSGNRSKYAGEIVDCGVANFTMVRMFHPYWCIRGEVPRDMKIRDKERCRHNYRLLIRKYERRMQRQGRRGGNGNGLNARRGNSAPSRNTTTVEKQKQLPMLERQTGTPMFFPELNEDESDDDLDPLPVRELRHDSSSAGGGSSSDDPVCLD